VGWEATETTRQTLMTSEHDSVSAAVTSLRVTGEVRRASARRSPRAITDARKIPAGMVDESMSGKENACECRRSLRVGRPQGCRGEVRVAIVAWKRGNARGAKGGRKAEAVDGDADSNNRNRLPLGLEHRGQKSLFAGIESSLHGSTQSRWRVMSLDHPFVADPCPSKWVNR
jgi:hypothetical protein